jgi:hypothetical protein
MWSRNPKSEKKLRVLEALNLKKEGEYDCGKNLRELKIPRRGLKNPNLIISYGRGE